MAHQLTTHIETADWNEDICAAMRTVLTRPPADVARAPATVQWTPRGLPGARDRQANRPMEEEHSRGLPFDSGNKRVAHSRWLAGARPAGADLPSLPHGRCGH
jgi:hypothetical protein